MFIDDNSVTGYANFSFQVKPIGAHLWHQAFAWVSSWWAFSQCVASGKSKLITPANFGKIFFFHIIAVAAMGQKNGYSPTSLAAH